MRPARKKTTSLTESIAHLKKVMPPGVKVVGRVNGMFALKIENARKIRIERERAYAKVREANKGSRANYVLK